MGSASIKFQADAESPDGEGGRCALSEPIQGVSPEQFWESLASYLRTRKPSAGNYETEYVARELDDGGVLTAVTYGSGSESGTFYTTHYLFPEKDEARGYFYTTDESLAPSSLAYETVLRAHREPFRLEYVQEQRQARLSGPLAAAMLSGLMKLVGYDVTVFADQPSPSEEGRRSVLTGPIADPELTTTEAYWRKLTERATGQGAELLVDGSLMMASSGWASATEYTTTALSEDGTLVVTRDHGADETLGAVKGWCYQRLLTDPARIELYRISAECRESGPRAAATVDALVNDVLRFARDASA